MEHKLKEHVESMPLRYPSGKVMSKRDRAQSLTVVRYADDLVVIHESKQVILECLQVLNEFLEEIGLRLKPEKTRITHTLQPELSLDGKSGFDFLGFTVKQYLTKYHSATAHKENVPNMRTLAYPSAKSLAKHRKRIGDIILRSSINEQGQLIERLNPIIAG